MRSSDQAEFLKKWLYRMDAQLTLDSKDTTNLADSNLPRSSATFKMLSTHLLWCEGRLAELATPESISRKLQAAIPVARMIVAEETLSSIGEHTTRTAFSPSKSIFREAEIFDANANGPPKIMAAAGSTFSVKHYEARSYQRIIESEAAHRLRDHSRAVSQSHQLKKSLPPTNAMPIGVALPFSFLLHRPTLSAWLSSQAGTHRNLARLFSAPGLITKDHILSLHSLPLAKTLKILSGATQDFFSLIDSPGTALCGAISARSPIYGSNHGVFRTEVGRALFQTKVTFNDKLTTELLHSIQRGVTQCGFKFGRVVVWGPVNIDALVWAQPKDVNDLGPIPDVEVIAPLILPSGTIYPLTLKSCRFSPPLPTPDCQTLDTHDQKAIQSIKSYFESAKHRLRPTALGSLNVPGSLGLKEHAILVEPTKTRDASELCWAIRSWYGAVLIKMREDAKATQSPVFSAVDRPELSEPVRFRRELSLRTENALKLFRMPEAVVAEIRPRIGDFVDLYAPILHQIVISEQANCRSSLTSSKHQRRVGLGYIGPSGGYPLALDHMILDMLRQYYANLVGKDNVDGNYISRHYDRVQSFPTSIDVPGLLSERAPDRVLELVFADPLRTEPYTIVRVPYVGIGIGEHFARTLVRLYKWSCNELRAAQLNQQAGSYGQHQNIVNRKFTAFLVSELPTARRMLQSFLRARRTLDPTSEKLTSGERKIMGKLSRGLANTASRLTNRALAFDGNLFQTTLPELLGIRDYEKTKFIYAIGADGITRYAEEADSIRRPSHSELLGGRAMYAGGQITFIRHERLFKTMGEWITFNATYDRNNYPWRVGQLDDGTGHYKIPHTTLRYASRVILPELEALGISTEHCRVEDRIAPGLPTSLPKRHSGSELKLPE